ncbi:helix-hairpin-helix domain-containing protein [Flavihumibacter rivuli]|uniref:ComEA family DNA-binding protein n=1 Tax=Flavihumibacter rivuli TaxID=2838156 RepID=UPI001BDE5AE5|nr:helix-hairpin-helix domain-containing protein [Flavihumibacter rivuli]ULQ56782.1 helix-hairpin-helix domain-containing protein [Flavihumibacter rivuli]
MNRKWMEWKEGWKAFGCMLTIVLFGAGLFAQQQQAYPDQHLEQMAERSGQENEDDGWLLDREALLKDRLSINEATASELAVFPFLTLKQIQALILFRKTFGRIKHIYMLQAVPGWDETTIRQVRPYIHFETRELLFADLRLDRAVSQQILFRVQQFLQKGKGFLGDENGRRVYLGGPSKLFFRYHGQSGQSLQWGLLAEKDAGEPYLWKGLPDRTGFYLLLKGRGVVRSLVIGDYTVSIGQGLVHWQGLAMGKAGGVMGIFRNASGVRPYRSAGEYNFNRGVAVQLQKGKWASNIWVSSRKLTANLVEEDGRMVGFSSINESGYHRTIAELADKGSVRENQAAVSIDRGSARLKVGLAGVYSHYSLPAVPGNAPYQLYAFRGQGSMNAGMHYSYSIRNLFLFGEYARSLKGSAWMQGLLLGLHPKVELSLLVRDVAPSYFSRYGNAFTESSTVQNEKGFFTGLRMQPLPSLAVEAFADQFRFPWLRFRADAPSRGSEQQLLVQWTKRKKGVVYLRYRQGEKEENSEDGRLRYLIDSKFRNLRLHAEWKWGRLLVTDLRLEWVKVQKGLEGEQGYSVFADGRYDWNRTGLNLSARFQYFGTDGYASRIYAYERDVQYAFSIPAMYDRGWRYYLQLGGKWKQDKWNGLSLKWWLRWSSTIYADRETIGSGWDEVNGPVRSEIKFQLMVAW